MIKILFVIICLALYVWVRYFGITIKDYEEI